jgi:formylglycine-generating enzyme required for sulfatase activity
MVFIPAGPFLMGSPEGTGRPDEHPRHKVQLKEFYISRTEVTAREYCRFLNAEGLMGRDGVPRVNLSDPTCPIVAYGRKFRPKKGMAFRPITCVSWYGAKDYAQWLGGRLPTAAEWEKAALLTTPNPPGDFLTILPRTSTVPVSLAVPGLKGVSGMIGNVWEWCSDWYARDYYANSSHKNPQGPSLGKLKEIRGGSWAAPEACRRITNRHKAAPQGYFRTVGFRIVMD